MLNFRSFRKTKPWKFRGLFIRDITLEFILLPSIKELELSPKLRFACWLVGKSKNHVPQIQMVGLLNGEIHPMGPWNPHQHHRPKQIQVFNNFSPLKFISFPPKYLAALLEHSTSRGGRMSGGLTVMFFTKRLKLQDTRWNR